MASGDAGSRGPNTALARRPQVRDPPRVARGDRRVRGDGPLSIELVVSRDLPEAGARLFLSIAPKTVSLAGGTTPRPLYERLSATPYPWEEVEVFFGDERCVQEDHPDSDFRMARETLLDRVPARVHPMTACDPDAYAAELKAVFGDALPRFDLVLLGLGEDGHTASLFPGDPALEVKDRWVTMVRRPDHDRMTLTLPVLSAAHVAMFLVSGASKQGPLAELLGGGDIPAARVRAERTIVLCDPAAAGD